MSSIKKMTKLLASLSQDELHETRNRIDAMISNREEEHVTKSQKEGNKATDNFSDLMRLERLYHIFTCKFKKVNELKKPAYAGTVVDISKSGLRIRTKKKIAKNSLLVIFPEKKTDASVLAISPEYDHDGNKIFAEVIRVKELLEMCELGCKFLPRKSLLFDMIV
ncbi:MAG TPA: PilZ domain-containing protein [Candidatus Brocadia sapporoensis]|nr:PilZ domain-containing protein [Candidatus Brocadia sp.]TVL95133.1 MAG: hypothetical protein CV082_12085 [Candidatus Brocadia sp. BL1]HQU31913.1 PilZ domain-containing protein [Candidatus Brocadia sapporoensis]